MNGVMTPAKFESATRVVFGAGKVSTLGEFARDLGAWRVLVASDPGVIAAGHTGRGIDSLTNADLDFHLFDGVQENPTTANVEAGLIIARQFRPDLIVGFGGGSSMDCAKGINFLYSCGGRMQDYWGIGKATGPLLPMIAVPTTAGTGSETQSFALISDAETHVKMACGDKRAAFRVAILDPELTVTQPPRVAALAGFDALSHAVETFVTKKRNEISCDYSQRAWRELAPNYLRVLEEPNNLEAQGHMQMGACLAGSAIENSMLGAAHALANPLTATYGIAHGEAVALMLPHVVRFNGGECNRWYHELLATTEQEPNCPRGGANELADFLRNVATRAGLPDRLEACGVERGKLSHLAEAAACQWTATFNPIAVGRNELLELYEAAY
jgi:alcohol dehydrogenase